MIARRIDQADGEGNYSELEQDGDANEAYIDQSGDGNSVGSPTGLASTSLASQGGDDNVMRITQTSDNNEVGLVRQNTATGSSVTNDLTILQTGGNGNRTRITIQSTIGGDDSGDNVMNIVQNGSDNDIRRVTQKGADNFADIDQTGSGNLIMEVRQGKTAGTDVISNGNTVTISQSNADNKVNVVSQFGDDNSVSITQSGLRNGRAMLTGVADVTTSSDVYQEGSLNTAYFSFTGNDNAFGSSQIGVNNTIGTVSVTGNANETGFNQDGNDNIVDVSTIDGDGNIIGISQSHNANYVGLTLVSASSDNIIDVDQSANPASTGRSTATILINGSQNFLWVDQNAARLAGMPQTVEVSITGNLNNAGSFSSGFASLGLTAGHIKQMGSAGLATFTVAGNSNLFASSQSGRNDNVIDATISGNSNQMAVRQNGTFNTATLSQFGTGNNMTVTQ